VAKEVFIIGNGPLPHDLSGRVDGAAHVVRFNEPKASIDWSGTRTDWLFVNNSGKPMQRRILSREYAHLPTVQAADFIFFAYHPITIRNYLIKPNFLSRLKGRRADWTLDALEMFGRVNKKVAILPPSYYEEGCDMLGIPERDRRTVFPTTGFFGIRYTLERFAGAEWDIHICGFSWEGWKRHAWNAEREWMLRQVEERNLTFWRAG